MKHAKHLRNKKVIARLRDRVGNRGAALLIFAFIDFVVGWSLLDRSSRPSAIPAYRAISDLASFQIWGWFWWVIALICSISAFTARDVIGFTAAIFVKIIWAMGFFAAWLLYDVPRAWLGGATWLVFAMLVLLIAGWAEPRKTR